MKLQVKPVFTLSLKENEWERGAVCLASSETPTLPQTFGLSHFVDV